VNAYEREIYDSLRQRGWKVLRRGWPDFLVMDKGWSRGFALEVKRNGDKLTEEQAEMHKALARFGIMVHVVHDEKPDAIRKTGKKFLMTSDLTNMKARFNKLASVIELLLHEQKRLADIIAGGIVLCSPPDRRLEISARLAECIDAVQFLHQEQVGGVLQDLVFRPDRNDGRDLETAARRLEGAARTGINVAAALGRS